MRDRLILNNDPSQDMFEIIGLVERVSCVILSYKIDDYEDPFVWMILPIILRFVARYICIIYRTLLLFSIARALERSAVSSFAVLREKLFDNKLSYLNYSRAYSVKCAMIVVVLHKHEFICMCLSVSRLLDVKFKPKTTFFNIGPK